MARPRDDIVSLLRAWLHRRRPSAAFVESLGERAWRALAVESVRQGVAPILHDCLEGASDAVPPAAVGRLSDACRESAMAAGVAVVQLEELLEAMSRAGVGPPILLKGVLLGPTLYPSVSLRPLRDVDILIRSEDRETVRQLAQELGYARAPIIAPTSWHAEVLSEEASADTYAPEPGAHRLSVDVHLAVIPGSDVLLDRLWADAEQVELGSARALAPRREHLLLLLLLHIVQHLAGAWPPPRLLWWLDVALLLHRFGSELDWDEFQEASRGLSDQVAARLAQCLKTVDSAFECGGAPETAIEALTRGSGVAGPLDMLGTAKTAGLRDAQLILRRSPRLASRWARLRWAAGYVLPGPEYVRARHGVESRLGLVCWYLARPVTALFDAARAT